MEIVIQWRSAIKLLKAMSIHDDRVHRNFLWNEVVIEIRIEFGGMQR